MLYIQTISYEVFTKNSITNFLTFPKNLTKSKPYIEIFKGSGLY